MARVVNKKCTSNDNPPSGYDSWKDYWEKSMGRRFSTCSCTECFNSAEVGGHVIRVGDISTTFIVPICFEHNNYRNDEPYYVHDNDLLRLRQ